MSTARPLVLLPGWGMGPSAFADLRARLEPARTVCSPALPASTLAAGADLDRTADALLAGLPRPAHWVGWSLGGLLALAAARRAPSAVARITLLASAPRLVAASGWPGIDPAELAAFRRSLDADPRATHGRFLALQVRGCEGARATLRALRQAAATDGVPCAAALEAGLALLANTDLRGAVGRLSCPVDAVLGSADALLPATVARPLEELGIRATTIAGAAHVPFVSHPAAVAAGLLE